MLRSFVAPRWAALLSVVAVLFCCSPASAEWAPGKYMSKAVARVLGSAKGLSDISDYGFDNDLCILATYLGNGKNAAFNKYLQKGEYLILGGGDDEIKDLDIVVSDADGDKVAEDTQDDASPLVRFNVKSAGKFTLKAIAAKADKGGFVCLVIMRKGGYTIPVKNLATALASLIKSCEVVDSKISEKLYFHEEPNQWALFGSVLDKGEETTITNINMGTGTRVVVAAGDGVSTDIDLFVKTSKDGVVAKDEDADPTPIVSFRANSFTGAKVTYKNVASRGKSLILTAVLHVEK